MGALCRMMGPVYMDDPQVNKFEGGLSSFPDFEHPYVSDISFWCSRTLRTLETMLNIFFGFPLYFFLDASLVIMLFLGPTNLARLWGLVQTVIFPLSSVPCRGLPTPTLCLPSRHAIIYTTNRTDDRRRLSNGVNSKRTEI